MRNIFTMRQRRLQRRIREIQRRCGIVPLDTVTYAPAPSIAPIDAVAMPAGSTLPRHRHRAIGADGIALRY